ncbi:MAG: hypothetical protein TE42_07940 [Candidatus Synechococcus spongiarum SP3]|uniref:Uncharacterized protein n=1 Tax=Candidatus Synechococcus spongiarum SP3 TaxID=1604020 RepID=A0A0G2J4E1_9SYNE|nr:MAG: hypothetical protein TE42_07940 [Candidatus Synechococcus spongiarum SP3]
MLDAFRLVLANESRAELVEMLQPLLPLALARLLAPCALRLRLREQSAGSGRGRRGLLQRSRSSPTLGKRTLLSVVLNSLPPRGML